MKYLLIPKNDISRKHYIGRVYIVIKEDASNYTLEVLCNIKNSSNKLIKIRGDSLTHGKEPETSINVTGIYNKIDQFCKKLSADKYSDEWSKISKIDDIRKKFKNGIFPTKSEFHYMNKLWNKIK